MLPYFWYILKVIICSGILFGYYWLFLRNKIFHQYNRFYLLIALTLSLLLPMIKINFWQQDTQQSGVIKALQAVSASDDYMNNVIITSTKNDWSIQQLYPVVYWAVSFIFLLILLQTLFIIRSLLKRYPVKLIDKFSFVNTDDKSTPFSFFKYIFWNANIDMDTTTGKQIFKHEVAHIQENHTYDKLFVNILLVFFWCNPFFWLYRKELNMIHEFIADKKAVEDSDTASFAAMILQAAYPQHRFQLTNNFFYSPIKRRLLMLTKNNNPRVNYITRVMVLPLAVLVFAAFSLKAKTNNDAVAAKLNIVSDVTDKSSTMTLINSLVKSSDDVKKSIDTIPNKNIAVAVTKGKQPVYILNGNEVDTNILNRLNPNEIERINILKDRSAFEKYGERGNNGVIEITLKKNEITRNEQTSVAIAQDNSVAIALDKMNVFYVGVDNPITIAVPDVTSDKLLVGIDNGSITGSNGKYIVRVTSPGTASIKVATVKNDQKVLLSTQTFRVKMIPDPIDGNLPIDFDVKYKSDSSRFSEMKLKLIKEQQNKIKLDIAEKTLAENKTQNQQVLTLKQNLSLLEQQNKTALKLNERTVVGTQLKLKTQGALNLNQKQLLEQQSKANLDYTEKLLLEKSKDAYLEKALLYQKEILAQQNNLVFTKTEVSPQFTGGEEAWRKYLIANLKANTPVDEGWKEGVYKVIVKFIVQTDGTVSDITTENYKGSKTALHCIEVIKNAPKWQPAIQNGKNVDAYKRQPITFVIE